MKRLQNFNRVSLIIVAFLLFYIPDVLAQQGRIHIGGDIDATLTPGSGMLQLGETSARNMLIDANEILARDNGAKSPLFLNIEGGDVKTGHETTPSNLWATGFLRSGSDPENVRFKFHHETGSISAGGGSFTINLNLPAGTSAQQMIMVKLTKEGGLSNLVPIDIATYNVVAITANELLANGTVYHVGVIYIDN